jgi:hypothetical protein
MKKIFTILSFAAITAFYACGPSAEDKAAAEQARQDSIAAAAQADAESEAAAAQAMQDSIQMAEQNASADTAAHDATKTEEPVKH